MQKFIAKYEKYASWVFFLLMLGCLIPMAVLGFFNHPVGDDFYYGCNPALVWQETGNVFKVLASAFSGTVEQYHTWQGNYSAMFLMHLSPFVWGDFFYKVYPTVLFICFAGSIGYLTHVLICDVWKAKKDTWRLISSLLVLVCVEQVPLCGETFYWYNGSMYYTGFLACTFVFFGLLIKTLYKPTAVKTAVLSVMAVFLAGGNYISLLPAMILLVLFILYELYQSVYQKKSGKQQLLVLGIVFACMCAGFLVNALAPGNAVRQGESWKISPIKAVLKSIYHNSRYCLYWNGIWSLLFFIFVTPSYLGMIAQKRISFRYPVLVCGLIYGIYCSSSCPTFYAQNNGGAARVFCLVYYLMLIALAGMYFYALGAVCRLVQERKQKEIGFGSLFGAELAVVLLFAALSFVRPWQEAYVKPHSLTAVQTLLNGEAMYYEAQYRERLQVLQDPTVTDVVTSPYDVPAALEHFLYLGDISEDENNHVNQSIAAIYHKNSIKVR